MEKKKYNVILAEGVDETQFLTSGDGVGLEIKSNPNLFDGLICFMLTEDEANVLKDSSSVEDIIEEPIPVPVAYPTSTLSREAIMITRNTPSTSGRGQDYAGTNFWYTGEQGGTANTGPIGWFTSSGEDAEMPGETIQQKFAGQYVDVVAIEAGGSTASSAYDGYEDHIDFQEQSPQTFNITVINDGTSAWLLTGSDRLGSFTSASNKTLLIYGGDTVNFTNNATSSHPFEIVTSTIPNTQISGVTNQGGFGGTVISWTAPIDDAVLSVTYRCSVHTTTMKASLLVTGSPSRFVLTDWSTYDSAVVDPVNNQVTNTSGFWTSHAIGVLSAAAGSFCGWCKVSEMRLIYLDDGIPEAYNAVLAWHNAKPVNPETGLRNATVVTGSYGFPSYDHSYGVPIDEITKINAYDVDGNLTVINRPGGGWGTDYTPFTDNLLVPRLITDPVDSTRKWCITSPVQSRYFTYQTIMNSYESAGGIYHFKSAGNSSKVGVKLNDGRWNTNIEIDSDSIFIGDFNNLYSIITRTNPPAGSGGPLYPLWTFDNFDDRMFIVAAAQHSTQNPLLDDYSSRGPMVDVAGMGAYTWTAYPVSTYTDGKWGYFSGTSCAAPQAGGAIGLIVENFMVQRGVYPSTTKLKEIVAKYAKEVVVGVSTVDFSNTPSPADFPQSRLYSSGDVYSIKSTDAVNGGTDLSDLHGAPADRVFVPWGIYMGTGQYIADPRGPSYGKRPSSGQMYPRRKIRVGA